MQYNQPYGVTDTNAPYINGNPSTGTMGSIPPAASIEYPQREIVEVITDCGITPSNDDLKQLARAIQSGLLNFAVDIGTVNALVITLPLTPSSYLAGLRIYVLTATTPTGPSVINASGLGNKQIVKAGGVQLVGNEWIAGDIISLSFNGTVWQLIGVQGGAATQPLLGQNLIYYVSPTGSDTNDGLTTSTPFATWTHALSVAQKFNTNGFNITIQSLGGTWTVGAYAQGAFYGGGNIILKGDVTNPAAHAINAVGVGSAAISATYGAVLQVEGLYLTCNSVPNGAVWAQFGGEIDLIGNCIIGPSAGGQICALNSGQVRIRSGITLTGNSGWGIVAASLGTILKDTSNPVTITMSGTPNYTNAFAGAHLAGFVGVEQLAFSGGATGIRYSADTNSLIDTGGGGASYFPGSVAGGTATGGLYV